MTPMARWNPWSDFELADRGFRHMLGWDSPAADVYETEDEFVVELETPGFDQKEIEIEVSNHTLRIHGERKEAREAREKTYRLHERFEHSFERRFELPPEADCEHLAAVLANGLVEIHAPKTATAGSRRVAIEQRS